MGLTIFFCSERDLLDAAFLFAHRFFRIGTAALFSFHLVFEFTDLKGQRRVPITI